MPNILFLESSFKLPLACRQLADFFFILPPIRLPFFFASSFILLLWSTPTLLIE